MSDIGLLIIIFINLIGENAQFLRDIYSLIAGMTHSFSSFFPHANTQKYKYDHLMIINTFVFKVLSLGSINLIKF